MSRIIQHIKNQVTQKNRNFVAPIVGRVGTGKSYCGLRLCEQLYPNFDIDKHLYWDILQLADDVQADRLEKGSCILFDEAGIAVSNRQSYMNKFNKAMSFILQTWRHRNIILFLTVPDLAFIDKGVRKMCDALVQCDNVVKSRKVVQVKWKWIQVNQQKGEMYFHGAKSRYGRVMLEIGKPSTKLINKYEKAKTAFTTSLYETIKKDISPEQEAKISEIDTIRRCPICEKLGYWLVVKKMFRCKSCGNEWKKPKESLKSAIPLPVPAII